MKRITKMLVLALAMVFTLSLGAGSTAEAAKKVTVSSVKVVNPVNGKAKKTITLTLAKGSKKTTLVPVVTVKPDKAANKKVTYKSSNKKVATVTKKGKITAKKVGNATITVTSKKNTKKKATVKVKVVKGKVTKVTLDQTTASLKEGEKVTLKATVKASNKKKANTTVAWSSSDESVATVSNKGVVTAKKAGTAKITAISVDGTKQKATCTVTVTPASYTATVTPLDATVEVKVAFDDTSKVQADIDNIAKFANSEVEVTLDGKTYTAAVVNGQVLINGKSVAEKAKNAKDVTVKVAVKAEKIGAVVLFTPASVKSVDVNGVVFTEFAEGSVKIGDNTYSYTLGEDGKSIVVTGATDPAEDLKVLIDAQVVSVQ